MYENIAFWTMLICFILLTAVFFYELRIRVAGSHGEMHSWSYLIGRICFRFTSVVGFAIGRLEKGNRQEKEGEFARYPMRGEALAGAGKRELHSAGFSGKISREEHRRKQFRLKILD